MLQRKQKTTNNAGPAPKRAEDFELPGIPDNDPAPPLRSQAANLRQTFWRRIRQWIARHKKLSIAIALALVLLLAGGVFAAYALLHTKKPSTPASHRTVAKAMPAPPAETKYYSPLTGLQVPNAADMKHEVTAIMIENSPTARPQSGLHDAGVVFEAIAEGGITRFAALYQMERPGLIGPVRSLRPYYLSWVAPFDASIAHVGGSYNALQEVRIPGKYKDIDEFFNGSYYWRTTDRYAPHNVYTNFDRLDRLNASKGYTASTFTGFPRKNDTQAAAPTASSININISSSAYNVHYDYDRGSNTYFRSEGGAPHVDRESGRIMPRVVIAMKVPTVIGWEDGYREQMTVIGSGQAYVFQDGTVQQAAWTKAGQKSQLRFVDAAGKDIPLNRGQTWITATPTEQSVSWQ